MTTHLDDDPIGDPSDDLVVSSLDALAELPEWLAAGMHGSRVAAELTQHTPELRDGSVLLLACAPERLRVKAEGQWMTRYRLGVADTHGRTRDVVLVGNLWAPSQPVPATVLQACTAEATDTAFGEDGWRCWLPELRLSLHAESHDEALPALPTLVEPEAAARFLESVLRDAGRGDATVDSARPNVVRYKPSSRCTVVVDVTYASGNGGPVPPSPVVLKTHHANNEKGQNAWEAMTALWGCRPVWEHAVTLAEPLAFVPEQRILVQGPVPEERTLKKLAFQGIADGDPALLDRLRRELTKTARALAVLHRSGVSYGRTVTFQDELVELREVVGRLSLTVPTVATAAEPLLKRLGELSEQEYADPMVPAHHDFRPAQVLLHHGSLGIIDFDGACMAEPALDLGRFRAKLRDTGISALVLHEQPLSGAPLEENVRLLDDLCEDFLAAYQEHAAVSRARVLLWESSDLLTSLLHTWTKVRLARVEPRMTVLTHQLRTSGLLASTFLA